MSSRIKTLVFSGGGNKGLSFIGCLRALEEYNILDTVNCYIGTSAGSIISTLIALGYTSEELQQILINIDFSQLQDITSEGIFNYFHNFGFDTGKGIDRVLRIFIRKKTDNEDITFSELYSITKKTLIITGTCLNTRESVFFSHTSHGDMKVIQALRISFSVPFVFNACRIDKNVYVDGCVSDNYPLDAVENTDEVLGFLLESHAGMDEIVGLDDFAISIVQSMDRKFRKYQHLLYDDITVTIPSDAKAINFLVTESEKLALFKLGYERTKTYLESHPERWDKKDITLEGSTDKLTKISSLSDTKECKGNIVKSDCSSQEKSSDDTMSITQSLISELSDDNKIELDIAEIIDQSDSNKNI